MTWAQRRRDALLKTVNRVHKAIVGISGGRLGRTTADLPIVKLTTTGRTSGRARTVMLATPIREDGRFVVVASKGGDDRHPDWYRNLVANPEIVVEPIGEPPVAMVARTANANERAELWPRIATGDDGYAAYQRQTDREIPVVICELP